MSAAVPFAAVWRQRGQESPKGPGFGVHSLHHIPSVMMFA